MTTRRTNQPDALFLRANAFWERRQFRAAFRDFKAGSEQGDAACQLNLGYCYDVGLGVRRNSATALRWYRRAHQVDRGGAAANNIGTVFRDRGARPAAIRWFKRAIALGDADAALLLAELYMQSAGGTLRALPYLKMACKHRGTCENTRDRAEALLKEIAGRR